MSKNIRSLSARHIEGQTLFEALTAAVENTDTPLPVQLRHLAEERLVSRATLLGTTSFYDFLKTDSRGKRAYVCNGTCCMLAGKQAGVHATLAERFSDDEIGEATCLGHCYRAGAFLEGQETGDAGHEPQDEPEPVPYYAHLSNAMFGTDVSDIEELYQLALLDTYIIQEQLSLSQLRGRGGAGFPFADKLAACASTVAGQKYVVCNADEGDPGAFSDRYLLEQQPHRVLAGMLAAGLAAGADTGFVYIRAEYPLAMKRVAEAIKAFEQTDAYAKSQFGFRIVRGAGAYICGEETALLNSIEGLRPEVRTRPPYPTQEGLYGQPTLLSNVETFAAVPWVLEHGGSAFAAIGTVKNTGTKLLSLDYGFNIPGVHEVEMGTPLQQVIEECGGGFRQPVKALQVGGPLGGVVPMDKLASLTMDSESFAAGGFEMGHAGIVTIPESFPMIDFLRHLFAYMAAESCGKCLPCQLGTQKAHSMLTAASKVQPLDRLAFDDLLETLEHGSLCGLGSALPLPTRNILEFFAGELREYFDEEGQA